jgi:ABC-type sugar transport system substrate-binding protein
MIKLAISLALLLTAGFASAQDATTPSAALTPDQCKQVWSTAVMQGETPAQAAAPNTGSLAQVDDFAQVDTNNDGAIDQKEFTTACGKGLIRGPSMH